MKYDKVVIVKSDRDKKFKAIFTGMKGKDKNDSNSLRNNFKGGSPLALEGAKLSFQQNKLMFEALDKKNLVFQADKDDSNLLDEKQLKE